MDDNAVAPTDLVGRVKEEIVVKLEPEELMEDYVSAEAECRLNMSESSQCHKDQDSGAVLTSFVLVKEEDHRDASQSCDGEESHHSTISLASVIKEEDSDVRWHRAGAETTQCVDGVSPERINELLRTGESAAAAAADVFSSSICSYSTNHKGNLKRLINVHTSHKRVFTCNHCPFNSRSKIQYDNHILVHIDGCWFPCKYCPFRTHDKDVLSEHMKNNHGRWALYHGEKGFACDQCPYRCHERYRLRLHLFTHVDEKNFACDLCPYRGKSAQNLKSHLVTHREKCFKCHFCSYKGKSKRHLTRHTWSHHE